ncbi:dihydrofolate reductase [Dysgonomonas sp. PFB1-18]|uniref:dihydrofolate reductase family protein n=1 Tax=unclassified Dysgonomonas TaxID=2630389 RepID=UPI0013D254B9|nr:MULTISPECIES: dihydrofolate reductase family protein [unclassified Dysgonomonas]MDL2302793.1 dihydrofolate reductase family protein [Dysgonomonas sp. OttesenSCG-928-D17]MDH6310325.1 dihydrofolate reductase [Dysgonomonas sp. PF1-14]MDH6340345.1 dihydrofolate reductase [Dysgonomonas sp. PF1-16]MDH6381875.1 dihydrofolate reductase [Dysgonomonas sp. PFB1-18]MDH6399316.1 dihydrofolate reductase [Dysgonomonas sp. PF1-23]
MKKIKLYIASSIDGYIARPDGDLDWLSNYPITHTMNYGYDEFFESVDIVIMGGRTYRDILNMDVVYPYESKISYVITRNQINSTKENIHFVTNNIIEIISSLKEEQGRDIWLVGGGELISMFLNYDLIDEMIITYIPILLGDGIPLFPKSEKESKWHLLNRKSYNNGVLSIEYQRIKE